MLETLSEIEMPDGTNILERLFKIDDLVFVLLRWFSSVFADDTDSYEQIIDQDRWHMMEKWLILMTVIKKLKSFRYDRKFEDDIKSVAILRAITVVLRNYENIFTLASKYPYVIFSFFFVIHSFYTNATSTN